MKDDYKRIAYAMFELATGRMTIRAAPKYAFAEISNVKTVEVLRELASVHQIAGYSKIKKAALIAALQDKMMQCETIQSVMLLADMDSLHSFLALAKQPAQTAVQYDAKQLRNLLLFIKLGFVQLYYTDEKYFALVPEELKKVAIMAYDEAFASKKMKQDSIICYAKACANLYGFIQLDEFVAIYNRQNSMQTNVDEVFMTLLAEITPDSMFCFWEDYIIQSFFEEISDDEEEFEELKRQMSIAEGKPRYIPHKEQLLRYANHSYFEETVYTRKLQAYVESICGDKDIAWQATDEANTMAVLDMETSDIFENIGDMFIELEDIAVVQQLMERIVALENNTRKWVNKGYTPRELNAYYSKMKPKKPKGNAIPFNVLRAPEQRAEKLISRNAPCPCGSGKKYKRCCGK